MFFRQSDINRTKKKAGMLVTESQSGDAPKPPYAMNTNEKQKKTRIVGTESQSGDAPKLIFSIKTYKNEIIRKSGSDQPLKLVPISESA